jgi:hypothetical protein
VNGGLRSGGRRIWAVLELLDRQLVARDGRLVGKVDDVEFELPDDPDGLPRVSALVSGMGALAGQLGGSTGRALAAAERRLAADRNRHPSRIDPALVTDIGSAVELAADSDALDVNRAERWTRDVIIDQIPGARHVAE